MKPERGYTVIELMMALTVLAIGVTGVIAMQKVTVASNQHAKNLAIATHIAQAWQERLAADAAQWNHPSPSNNVQDIATDTRWLGQVVGNQGVWLRPAYDPALDFGPSFDALGNVVSEANVNQAVYCTHVRFTWLYPDTSGNGLIRAEIRVFWSRDGMGTVDNKPICDPNTPPLNIQNANNRYHFVYQTTAIKQNTAQ